MKRHPRLHYCSHLSTLLLKYKKDWLRLPLFKSFCFYLQNQTIGVKWKMKYNNQCWQGEEGRKQFNKGHYQTGRKGLQTWVVTSSFKGAVDQENHGAVSLHTNQGLIEPRLGRPCEDVWRSKTWITKLCQSCTSCFFKKQENNNLWSENWFKKGSGTNKDFLVNTHVFTS